MSFKESTVACVMSSGSTAFLTGSFLNVVWPGSFMIGHLLSVVWLDYPPDWSPECRLNRLSF